MDDSVLIPVAPEAFLAILSLLPDLNSLSETFSYSTSSNCPPSSSLLSRWGNFCSAGTISSFICFLMAFEAFSLHLRFFLVTVVDDTS